MARFIQGSILVLLAPVAIAGCGGAPCPEGNCVQSDLPDAPCPEGYCSQSDLALAQDLYAECSGVPFFPACTDRSCVESAEEAKYLDIADTTLLGILDRSKAYQEAHFKLNDVSITTYTDPVERKFRVDYLFIDDWVRIREHGEVIPLDPFSETIFRRQLRGGGGGFWVKHQVGRPIPFSDLEAKIQACQGSVAQVDWCGLRFDRPSGDLIFNKRVGTIDHNANRCTCLTVNLETGDSTCEECVCWWA